MSKYTTQVRFICEHAAGLTESAPYSDVDDVIEAAIPKVFSFQFPIFDEAYRPVLERKILMHYYTREIGFETVGLWKLKMQMKLNEIMPYYNKLYQSELLNFDPFLDVDKRIEHKGSDSGTRNQSASGSVNNSGSQTTSTDAENWSKFSDTPQGGVTGLDSDTYMTNATKDTIDQTVASTAQNAETSSSSADEQHANKNEWVEVITGKQGTLSYSKLLEEFRATFLNIDMMIIDELEPLFMGIY